ncbi:MAG: CpXC domain-containing protein [Pseudomonadota bacterium]
MGLFHPFTVRLSDGESMVVHLATAVNAERFPEIRQSIIDGTFHRFSHPKTGKPFTVEAPFMYTDMSRDTFFAVHPPKTRFAWMDDSEALEQELDKIPASLSAYDKRYARVVYGLGELREKLVAQEAALDDRIVELMKVFLIHEHPFLIQKPRLRLMLDGVDDEKYGFVAAFDHDREAFEVAVPRDIADELVEDRDTLKGWVNRNHTHANIFDDSRERWVNFWRWSPTLSAIRTLREMARLAASGGTVPMDSSRFQTMLRTLPRGKRLPGTAKRDLRTLHDHAKRAGEAKLQDTLFEIRFGIELEDDWAFNNDPDDIDTLWSLLRDLPDSNVEGNANLKSLYLAEGKGGGWYEPWSGDVHIGETTLRRRERFEDVVRHEVGHAVHEKRKDDVDPWLADEFGWRMFDPTNAGIDAWVDMMGGWGTLTSGQRRDVRAFLRTALGTGSSWNPGPEPNAPAGHPWSQPGFGPRLAYERTGADWYRNNRNWFRVGDQAFFLNFWYQKLMTVGVSTLDLINRGMPSSYAAMSPYEFFAELYALYYDLDDRMRPNIPESAQAWLDTHIGSAGGDLGPAHRSGGTRIPRP